MTSTPIRLLLADVDGTLVTQDKELTAEAIAAVHELHARPASCLPSPAGARPEEWRCWSSRSTSRPHRGV